jgi:hypothetical protein
LLPRFNLFERFFFQSIEFQSIEIVCLGEAEKGKNEEDHNWTDAISHEFSWVWTEVKRYAE